MQIKAYLKPTCTWSNGVRAILGKYSLKYNDIDIVGNPDNYAKMVEKSGQNLAPCVEIDGIMLADVSGDEVENYLISNKLVEQKDSPVDVPTGSGCEKKQPNEENSKSVRFF